MHKPESVQENEIHKVLWDFEIRTYYLISAWSPDLKLKNLSQVESTVSTDHRVKMNDKQILVSD